MQNLLHFLKYIFDTRPRVAFNFFKNVVGDTSFISFIDVAPIGAGGRAHNPLPIF